MESKVLNKVILSAAAYFFIVFQVIADSDSSTIDVEIGSDEQGNKNSAISVKLSKMIQKIICLVWVKVNYLQIVKQLIATTFILVYQKWCLRTGR